MGFKRDSERPSDEAPTFEGQRSSTGLTSNLTLR